MQARDAAVKCSVAPGSSLLSQRSVPRGPSPLSDPPSPGQLLCLKSSSSLLQEEVAAIVRPLTHRTLTTIVGGGRSRGHETQEGKRLRPQGWEPRARFQTLLFPRDSTAKEIKLRPNHILILGGFGLLGKRWVEILRVGKGADFVSHIAAPTLHPLSPSPGSAHLDPQLHSKLLKYPFHTHIKMTEAAPNSCFSLTLQIGNQMPQRDL